MLLCAWHEGVLRLLGTGGLDRNRVACLPLHATPTALVAHPETRTLIVACHAPPAPGLPTQHELRCILPDTGALWGLGLRVWALHLAHHRCVVRCRLTGCVT
jgi:hypothetical protein